MGKKTLESFDARWTRAMKRRRAMKSKPIRPRRFQSTWRRRGEAPRGVSDEC